MVKHRVVRGVLLALSFSIFFTGCGRESGSQTRSSGSQVTNPNQDPNRRLTSAVIPGVDTNPLRRTLANLFSSNDSEFAAAIVSLSDTLAALSSGVSSATTNHNTQASQITALSGQVGALNTSLGNVGAQVTALAGAAATLLTRINALQAQVNANENQSLKHVGSVGARSESRSDQVAGTMSANCPAGTLIAVLFQEHFIAWDHIQVPYGACEVIVTGTGASRTVAGRSRSRSGQQDCHWYCLAPL